MPRREAEPTAQTVHRLHPDPVWNIGLFEQLLVNADGAVVMAQHLFPPRTLFQRQLHRQRRPTLERANNCPPKQDPSENQTMATPVLHSTEESLPRSCYRAMTDTLFLS